MKSWEEVNLGSVLEKIIGGGTPSMQNPDYWDGEIFWCTVKDMTDEKSKIPSVINEVEDNTVNPEDLDQETLDNLNDSDEVGSNDLDESLIEDKYESESLPDESSNVNVEVENEDNTPSEEIKKLKEQLIEKLENDNINIEH